MSNDIKLETEELGMFKEGLNDLLKTSLSVLNSLERHDLVEVGNSPSKRAERRKQIETIIKRTNLYLNYFNQTTSRDMDEHYIPMYKIYTEHSQAIGLMVKQLCATDSAVDTSWLSKNKITIVIDKDSDVILHVQVIFQLAMELRRVVENKIDVKYEDMIRGAPPEEVDELKEQMYDEKYGTPETSYVDRYLLALISIFLSISQRSAERKGLKIAASNIIQSLPQSSGSSEGGFLGGLGDILSDVMKNLQPGDGGMPDGTNIGEAITGALSSALGDGPLGEVLAKAGQSTDVGELTKNLSQAINNPELSKMVRDQVDRSNVSNSVAAPPKAGEPVPETVAAPSSNGNIEVHEEVEDGDDIEFG